MGGALFDPNTGYLTKAVKSFMDHYMPIEHTVDRVLGILKIDKKNKHYDSLHAYVKAHILYGVGHANMEELELRFVEPLKDAMRKHGITPGKFGRYLIARMAPGRNIHVDKILARGLAQADNAEERARWQENISKKKGVGSGIPTEEALARVKKLEADPQFRAFLKDSSKPLERYYDMVKNDLDGRVQFGLIEDAERIRMTKAASEFDWKGNTDFMLSDKYSYAPLVGFLGQTGKMLEKEDILETILGGKGVAGAGTGGRGLSQASAQHITKGAFGRPSEPDENQVLAQAFHQVSGGMIRGQRNEVAQSFGQLKDVMEKVISDGTLFGEKVDDATRALINKEHEELFDVNWEMRDGKKVPLELTDMFEEAFVTEEKEETEGALPLKIRRLKPQYSTDPRYFTYRVDGKPVLIKFSEKPRATALAESLNHLRYEALKNPAMKGINWGTKFIAKMVTTYNVSFVLGNFFRDYLTAYINLTEDEKQEIVGEALSPKKIAHFMKGIWQAENMRTKGTLPDNLSMEALKGMSPSEAQKDPVTAYLFAKAHGAKVGMFRHETVAQIIRRMDKDLKGGKWLGSDATMKKGWKNITDFVENANMMVENSIRISSFWAAINSGRSTQEAADISRNATVDFNRKGNLTQNMNAFYMFFGASMTSMHRMHKAIMRRGGYGSRKAMTLYAQLAGFSALLNFLNRILSDDDDDKEGELPFYDRVTPFLRDTHMHLPIPGWMTPDGEKRSLTIPVALGWTFPWTVGQVSMDMATRVVTGKGGEGPTSAFGRLMDSGQTAFNPIGSAGDWLTMLIPTVGMPVAEIGLNQNFMGQEIVKKDGKFNLPSPAYTRERDKTLGVFKNLSESLNSMMGGSATTQGNWMFPLGVDPLDAEKGRPFDLSGSEMEHFVRGYLGGPFDMVASLFGGGHALFSDLEDFKPEKIPGVRRFYRGKPSSYTTGRRFYGLRERVLLAKKELESAIARKDTAHATSVKRNYRSLLALKNAVNGMDNYLAQQRRDKRKVTASKISDSLKKQQLDKLEDNRIEKMLQLLAKANKLKLDT